MKILDVPSSGSQAGTTASHNRYGQYRRTRAMPVQPIASPRRAQVRANFTATSAAWATLSPSEQGSWVSYANSHPRANSLGQSIILTGQAMFIAINSQMLNIGNPITVLPPVADDLPAVSNLVVYADATGNVGLSMDAAGVGFGFLIAASRTVSGGVSFMSTFRQFMVGQEAQTLYDISDDFVEAFGLPAAGGRVFFRITPFNAYGVIGTGQKVIAQVVAASTLETPTITADSPGIDAVWGSGAMLRVVCNVQNVGITPDIYFSEEGPAATGVLVNVPVTLGEVYIRLYDGAQFSPRSLPFPTPV